MLILTAAVIAFGRVAGVALSLRVSFVISVSYGEALEPVGISWKDYPLRRLLDRADFEHLRHHGLSEARTRKLRIERRKLFRLCLRSLARDFDGVHRALSLVVAHSHNDRPDLAAQLAIQRVTFYRNVLSVACWLVLNACGCHRIPQIDVLQPLRTTQAQLGQLNPAAVLIGGTA